MSRSSPPPLTDQTVTIPALDQDLEINVTGNTIYIAEWILGNVNGGELTTKLDNGTPFGIVQGGASNPYYLRFWNPEHYFVKITFKIATGAGHTVPFVFRLQTGVDLEIRKDTRSV